MIFLHDLTLLLLHETIYERMSWRVQDDLGIFIASIVLYYQIKERKY